MVNIKIKLNLYFSQLYELKRELEYFAIQVWIIWHQLNKEISGVANVLSLSF